MSEHDSLSQRFDDYSAIIEGIVLRGIEHPSCELKRAVAISKNGDLTDRLEFIKLLQGLANSHSNSECFIVIGADQNEGKFIDVDNVNDFDPARLSPVFSKFLSPEPRYEIFRLKASTGEQYILFVLNRVQPRPIMALVDGKTDTKVHFRPGDIWIKHNTGLKNAGKVDLDLMYEPIIEIEAAKRARIVIEHLKQELGTTHIAPAVNPIPVEESLLGSRATLQRFIEARLATNEVVPFNMLLEMARHTIVDKWDKLNRGVFNAYEVLDTEQEAYFAVYSAEFLPIIQSVVDIGLVVIMYEGPLDWLKRVVDLLAEAFSAASQINRLVAFRDAETVRQSQPYAVPKRAEGIQITPLAIGRPAYEVYLGARVLATYATMRKRPEYLGALLSRFVPTLSTDKFRDTTEPILFWPFAGDLELPQMLNGRNEDYWQERVSASWPETFGSKEAFLDAAAGLELILELSSHIFVQYSNLELTQYKNSHPKKKYTYMPDFWRNPLKAALPTAEWIYEKTMAEKRFPGIVSIEPDLIQKIFANKSKEERILFYGEFLFKLRRWHDEVLMQQQRFPFYFDWPEPLQRAVDVYRASLPQQI